MNKTDNLDDVGKHKFELAGLGKAPFRYIGVKENLFKLGDGTVKPGGSCDYCGNGIRYEFGIRSSDGIISKVGCNCIEKVDDKGLLRAYKSSPDFRKLQAEKRKAKAREVNEEWQALLMTHEEALKAKPHPKGFQDRKTGQPLTAFNQWEWLFDNCGATGRARYLKLLKLEVGTPTA